MNPHNSSAALGVQRTGRQSWLGWLLKQQLMLALVALLLGLLISSAWLVFPYFVKDQNLLSDVGGNVKQERLLNAINIGRFLTRTTFGVGEAQVDMLYATPKFFEMTDRARAVSQYRPDLYHVFIIIETTHIEDLPTRLPDAKLFVDGREYAAYDVEGPLEVYHHRAVTIRFPAYTDDATPVITDDSRALKLELQSTWDPGGGSRTASWDLPLQYPEGLQQATVWTPFLVLGISAGLLSFVLTPCLLQLLVVYMVTLTGFSADQLHAIGKEVPGAARRRMLMVALAFVTGFAALFTLTGAATGRAGKEAQMFFAVWSPTLTVVAGVLVIVMGLWVGIRSQAPVVCRLVPTKLQRQLSGGGSYIGSALTAIGFSLGCLTCFGGAIIATLLVYVGSLGSALVGATVMFAFSMGIVIPFLLAAFFLSRTLPLLTRIQQFAPHFGLVSMLVIMAFGVVLVTDNFHVLSDFIYPYLGLG